MTINCGTIKKSTAAAAGAPDWSGEIKLASRMEGRIALYRNPRWKQGVNDNVPTHNVGYTPRGGTEMILGNAWTKYSEKNEGEFFSITIDNPDWPNAINLAAFSRDDGSCDLVWSRPRQKPEERKAA
jgi:uncharacterized protein (DUF736 family)